MKANPILILAIAVCTAFNVVAQANKDADLPYFEIPPYPEKFSAGNVAARVIDGLGFRYYWATAGLRETDLKFKPGATARTSLQTLTHIYELSLLLVNATNKIPNQLNNNVSSPGQFEELRRKTLTNFKSASDLLKTIADKDLENLKIIFKNDSETLEFPFWNELNGPVADMLWHVGQIVSFRRSSGNPFDEKADVFTGKWKE